MLTTLTLLLLLTAPPGAEQNPLEEIRRSHIEANVPPPADFHRFLLRDLKSYFVGGEGKKPLRREVAIDYELLRDGPTQSGVALPKFYVWVRVDGGKTPDNRGAARVAARDRQAFDVVNFLSERQIRQDPERLQELFPEPVCRKIEVKLGEAGQPAGHGMRIERKTVILGAYPDTLSSAELAGYLRSAGPLGTPP